MVVLPLIPLVAVLACLGAALAALGGGPGKRLRAAVAGSLLLTALWAGLLLAPTSVPAWAVALADLARAGAGVAVLVFLLGLVAGAGERAGGLVVTLGVLLALGVAGVALGPGTAEVGGLGLDLLARLGLDVLGLLVVENVFRNAGESRRWACKHLLLGFGAVYAFDLFALADAVLYDSGDRAAMASRPLVAALVAPLVAVSLRRFPGLVADISVSRALVLHGTALVGAGLYLIAVALAAQGLREGGAWAEVARLALMLGAALVLAVLVLSGEAKAKVRRWASRHLFPLAYDYRREWLRFIETMAQDSGDASLYRRSVRAVADVFDCAGGALFLHQRADVYVQVARHGWPNAASLLALPAPLLDRLRAAGGPVDLGDAAVGDDAALLAWLHGLDRPWLAVPLLAGGQLLGVILLGQPRAPRALGWEERELLQVLGTQVASYLREDQANRALAVAQRFERTGRRFTFVAHDVKTTVSQLDLVVRQADRHGHDPEFLADALETVRHSVGRLRALLVRLRDDEPAAPGPIDLAGLATELADRKRRLARAFTVRADGGPFLAQADPLAVATVLENLVQNAVEAAEGGVTLTLTLRRAGAGILLELADDGPGMTRSFVETRLFAPFASTKEGGFGIGMHQCRCLAEEWGGSLSVDSRPGGGTRVTLSFPAAPIPLAIPS